MRIQSIFITALISILFSSCVPTSYFQVYKTAPSEKMTLKNDLLIYEDENCIVSYNLWSEGGNIGFKFFNKTDKNIYINLEESFYILNGISYNYYRNRVFTKSTSSGTTNYSGVSLTKTVSGTNNFILNQTNGISAINTVGLMTSSGLSVAFNEEKIVCIPSKTSKIFTEYSINESYFRDCDLLKFPVKNQIKTKTYSKEESPFIFSNRITYSIGQNDSIFKFENEFYIAEISNYPEKEICELKYEEYCGQINYTLKSFFKNASADKFYIKYNKIGPNNLKY